MTHGHGDDIHDQHDSAPRDPLDWRQAVRDTGDRWGDVFDPATGGGPGVSRLPDQAVVDAAVAAAATRPLVAGQSYRGGTRVMFAFRELRRAAQRELAEILTRASTARCCRTRWAR